MYSLYKLNTATEHFSVIGKTYKLIYHTEEYDFKLHDRHTDQCKLHRLIVWYQDSPISSTTFYYYGFEDNCTLAAVFDNGTLYLERCNLEKFIQFFKSVHLLDMIYKIELVRTDLIDIAKNCVKHIKKEG